MGIHNNSCRLLWLDAHERSAFALCRMFLLRSHLLRTAKCMVWKGKCREVKCAAWWHRPHLILKGCYRASKEMFWATGESRIPMNKITCISYDSHRNGSFTHSSCYWAKSLLNSVSRALKMCIIFILQRGRCPFLAQRTLQCHLCNSNRGQVYSLTAVSDVSTMCAAHRYIVGVSAHIVWVWVLVSDSLVNLCNKCSFSSVRMYVCKQNKGKEKP